MDSRLAQYSLQELGVFHCDRTRNYENPRQGSLEASVDVGVIAIHPGFQFEQSIEDLRGFSHLWIIFLFHQAKNWKPMVSPPTSTQKRGVFSTRSPHRPNHLGLSVVEVVRIEGRKIHVKNFDLLDGTPVLDIKPYVTAYDSIPEAAGGWTSDSIEEYFISWSPLANEQMKWLKNNGLDLQSSIERSLRYKPFDKHHKRVKGQTGGWVLALQTWRVEFCESNEALNTLLILRIYSGYPLDELENDSDTLSDKSRHRDFLKIFNKEL